MYFDVSIHRVFTSPFIRKIDKHYSKNLKYADTGQRQIDAKKPFEHQVRTTETG